MKAPVLVLRPRGEEVEGRPDVAIVPFGRDRALLLLTRIQQLRETRERDPDVRSVFRTDPDPVYAYDEGAIGIVEDADVRAVYAAARAGGLTLLGRPTYPFRTVYQVHDLDVQIEVGPDDIRWHLVDTRDGRRFETGPLTVADLACAALATAPDAEIPGFFGRLVHADAVRAIEVLDRGIDYLGRQGPRDVRAHLARTDLLPLLEHTTRGVRERTQALLGTIRPERAR